MLLHMVVSDIHLELHMIPAASDWQRLLMPFGTGVDHNRRLPQRPQQQLPLLPEKRMNWPASEQQLQKPVGTDATDVHTERQLQRPWKRRDP
jgi:hypothetical protein